MLNPASIPTPLVGHHDSVAIVASDRPTGFTVLTISARLIWWGLTILGLRLTRSDGAAEYGRRFRLLLEDLGGLWIKLGQLLSLRVDLFPLEFCRELSQLQVKVVGFPVADAIRIIEEEYHQPLASIFHDFEQAPLAAASMGQVHLAHLRKSGVRVAIKVQRPHLPTLFQQQLRVIATIVWVLQRLRFRPNLRWEELLWELTQIMREEMDCRFEASTTRRMRRTLKRHGIYAPKVFFASSRVLVTEFIDGALMADYIRVLHSDPHRLRSWLAENHIEPNAVGERLMVSLLRQILEDNLFHADLHPGNVMLLRDSRIALIDFGAGSFTEREYLERFSMTVQALAASNYTKATDMTLLNCGTLPRVDLDGIREQFVRTMRAWAAKTTVPEVPYHQKSVAALYNDLIRILYEHDCTMEWALLRIRRAQETLDASLLYLTPQADYSNIAFRYFRAADRRELAATVRPGSARLDTLSAVSAALEATDRVEEFALFRVAEIRRRVQRFQDVATRIGDLAMRVVSGTAVVTCAATALVAVVVMSQRYPLGAAALFGESLTEWMRVVPPLDAQLSTIVLAISCWSCLSLARLRRRMLQHDGGSVEEVPIV